MWLAEQRGQLLEGTRAGLQRQVAYDGARDQIDFHELKPDLFVVGTQLDHSRKIIFGRFGTESIFDKYSQYASNATISDAVAASMSLPPIFAPYKVELVVGMKRASLVGKHYICVIEKSNENG